MCDDEEEGEMKPGAYTLEQAQQEMMREEPGDVTPEIARQLAQDSVAALKPGDVLAVRVTPTNARELHHLALYGQRIEADTGVKVAFIPGLRSLQGS